MVLKSLKVDILVTGHTHMPLYMRVNHGVLINPGSIYTFNSSRETSQTYGVLDTKTLAFNVFYTDEEEVVSAEIEYEY
ncbi:MAG: metallophosphoesterase family protein [Chloroflexota bacterium]